MICKSSKKITASTSSVALPAPYNKYYEIISDSDLEDETGMSATPYLADEVDGYDIEHLAYVKAKPEYMGYLEDDGFAYLELVREGDKEFLAYVIGDRIYPLYIDEILSIVGEDPEEIVESCDTVEGAIDTGLEYWYYGRHGIGPGTIPQGVTVLDTVEEGWKTWMLLDKLLTTEELKYYDLKEEWPPEGSISHNGTVIASCDTVEGATVEELEEAMNKYKGDVDRISQQLDDLQNNVKERSGLFGKRKKKGLFSGECTEVSQDDENIEYVVSSDDEPIEGMSLINYKDFKILPNSHQFCWDVFNDDMELIETGFPTESEARKFIDINLCTDIFSSEDLEEDEWDEEMPEQEYSSAETAINGKQGKLPAAFKRASIPNGALVLDYGGGTVESEQVAQDYLDQFNAIEMLYDPYNQTAEHNREVVSELRRNGGADVAICSNVLNVIKEEAARLGVLKKIQKLLKPSGIAYITVYEGGGSAEGKATQQGRSWQNNRKTVDYLEEIQSVFPDATRKGQVIIAPNYSDSIQGSTTIEASNDVDIELLDAEITNAVRDTAMRPDFGFPEEEVDDYFFVETIDEDDRIVVQVRAEVSYDGMMRLAEVLDPIIAKYDPYAYFEQVTGGIMEAIIWKDDSVYSSTSITADYNADMTDRLRDRYLEPPDREEVEDMEDAILEFPFDLEIEVDEDGTWDLPDTSFLLDYFDPEETGLDDEEVGENFGDLLSWFIPEKSGRYKVTGNATLKYTQGRYSEGLEWDYKNSAITDPEVSALGPVESSTKVTAAMTEEDLDTAILEGKPFDLESFRKYKTVEDPTAIKAQDVEVGDVITVDEDASEVNLGTVVKVLKVNSPAEDWIDYSFTVELLSDPGLQGLERGSIMTIHFDTDESVGHLVVQ